MKIDGENGYVEEDEPVYALNSLDDLSTVYFALAEYRDKLVKDIATCYDRSKDYGIEDEMFLAGTLGDVCRIMYDMESLPDLDASAGRSMIYNPSGRGQATLLNSAGLSAQEKKEQRAATDEGGGGLQATMEALDEERIAAGVADIERVATEDRIAAYLETKPYGYILSAKERAELSHE